MQFLQALCFLLAYRPSRFAGEGAHDQPSAHADEAVNAPVGKLDPALLQRFPPGEHVLINAVHQRSIQIEDEYRIAMLLLLAHVSWIAGQGSELLQDCASFSLC